MQTEVEDSRANADRQRPWAFFVNGTKHKSDDATLMGRDILRLARFQPASEHVLVLLTRPGSRTVGLDETVDVSASRENEFRAFAADRSFNFTVDEVGYEWGARKITVEELRGIADIPQNRAVFLERTDETDFLLADDAEVDLGTRGTEHIRTGKKLITVYYAEDQPFEIERGVYTGAQLAAIFGVPAGYVLDLIKASGEFDEIEPGESLRVKDGMHFASHPPCGQSS